ncbi:MAG: polyprenyl synthetase family protein, partial [Comamonadaceae bacterium]|nr:polyprenyl synthetase family protein [Comamonadaceae bacterium]
ASVQMGAACAPGAPPAIGQALHQYGQALGLAFQVVDDVLDATADSATLGKTAGKDAADNKPTYVSIMGVQAARAYADALHARACAALEATPALAASPLRGLADLVVQRAH